MGFYYSKKVFKDPTDLTLLPGIIEKANLEKASKESYVLTLGSVPEGALATRREGTSFTEESSILPGTVTREASEDIKSSVPHSSPSPEPTFATKTNTTQHMISDKSDQSDLAISPQDTVSAPAKMTLEASNNANRGEQQTQLLTPTPSPKKARDSKFEETVQTTTDADGGESNNQHKPTPKPDTDPNKKDGDDMGDKAVKDKTQIASSKRHASEVTGSDTKRVKADFSAEEKTIAEKQKLLEERRKKRQEARERANDAEVRIFTQVTLIQAN